MEIRMQTRSLFLGAVAALAAAPVLAAPETFEIDSTHSATQFAVKHMVYATVRGGFGKTAGRLAIDKQDWSKSSVEATIDATTIDTRDPKRDGHLKSPDFLDVAQYPTITFKSTKVEPAGAGKLKAAGNLTIHGVTKPVFLDIEGPSPEFKDPWGNQRVGATARTKINRKDFGVNWSQNLDTGGAVVGDEVDITIDIEAVKKAAKVEAKK
jgi:polyisoprenoid-binding protein YceI